MAGNEGAVRELLQRISLIDFMVGDKAREKRCQNKFNDMILYDVINSTSLNNFGNPKQF